MRFLGHLSLSHMYRYRPIHRSGWINRAFHESFDPPSYLSTSIPSLFFIIPSEMGLSRIP